MQKSKSHSFVIFPSTVRSIPFTVPVLLPSSTSSSHFSTRLDDLGPCSSHHRAPSPFSSNTNGFPPRHDGALLLPTCSEHPSPQHSPLTVKRKGTRGDRWASQPCCLDASPRMGDDDDGGRKTSSIGRNNNNSNSNSNNTSGTGGGTGGGTRDGTGGGSGVAPIRRLNFGLSCDSIASQRTIDLEDANLLFGIDPSLYLSTESGLDDESGSSIGRGRGRGRGGGGGGAEDGDEVDVDADEDDFYSGVYDESNIGRIWFSLEYDPETERLLVSLHRIRNLPNQLIASHRDPVVRIWLMPDERRWVQAKFKKKTCNPRFNENFAFQVSSRDFSDRSIKLTVFGSGDRHNRRQVAFGHVIYPLRDHVYEPNERIVIWRDLERESTMLLKTNEDAQLHLSLSYNGQLNRLNVAVHSGKNFPPSDDHDRSSSNEFYVVVSLMEMSKVVKKKKTSVVKQSINFSPIFNDLFQFKVRSTSLDVTSLLVTAMRHVVGHKDRQIGRLVLGSFMFARGPELDHWNAMLANEKEQIAKWHKLTN